MNETKSVLIVEDNPEVSSLMKQALQEAGYEVLVSDLLASGFNIFLTRHPSLVIVDLDLPDGSGLDLCGKIRAHKPLNATPIIILTGHTEIEEKLKGFSCGADQYLNKPLGASELVMWVKALLKRVELDKGVVLDQIAAGGLVIEKETQLVKFNGATVNNLTVREFQLLYVLVNHRPKVLSRKFILTNSWNTVAVDHLVDTHIYNLRKKLPKELADKIQSVPGRGFRFFEPE
jgi:DNA-binding response OmpR family regulator